jgi:hypothetical protein
MRSERRLKSQRKWAQSQPPGSNRLEMAASLKQEKQKTKKLNWRELSHQTPS